MNIKYFLIFISLLLTIYACEKVVYIDLNSVNSKVVVEGNITDGAGPFIIKLTKTVNYYDANEFPAATGARAIITDNIGQNDTLKEFAPGIYATVNLQGISGRTYYLSILTKEGTTYHAFSDMASKVPIDSINFEFNKRNNTYRVICKFKDPENIVNYYKLQAYSNNPESLDTTNIRVLTDKLRDGQEMSITYRTRLLLGDSITLKLESIDKAAYDFYRTLPNAGGDLNPFLSAPPANPISNINNGGLGYFSAHGESIRTAVAH